MLKLSRWPAEIFQNSNKQTIERRNFIVINGLARGELVGIGGWSGWGRGPVRTFIFGILNITEDSFSDAGRFLDPKAARDHARSLMADGANALDVGGASSNPRSNTFPPTWKSRA
jgi:hypothetical protein